FHGYTYSAHPLACAAGLATLDLYRDERLFERAHKLEPLWAEAAMSLKGLPNVLDIRCVGLTAGIGLASRPGEVGKRAYDAMDKAFREQDLVIRAAGESIVLTPPLIVSEGEIEEMFAKAARVIKGVAYQDGMARRERGLRPQDRPADGEHVIAAAERQRERRLNLGIARDAAQAAGHDRGIETGTATGPHHHRALA